MSWINRINNIELIIITGDGREYKPLWKDAQKNVEFNTEAYNFINVPGTFVQRSEIQGQQFPLLLYFQGDDNIEQAAAFKLSSEDKRAWTIKHPLYDDIKVQPLNLQFNNSSNNVTIVTGVVWETIEQKYPDDKLDPVSTVLAAKSASDATVAETTVNNIGTPSPETPESSGASVVKLGLNFERLTDLESITELKNLVRRAAGAAQEIIQSAERYINDVIDLINFPFTVADSVETAINSLLLTVEDFGEIFTGENATPDNLVLFESQTSVVFTELSRNIINSDESQYLTRATVVDVIALVNGAYDQFLVDLENNGVIQDKQIAQDLDVIVNLALGTLFDIAFNAKQERTFILDKDDNIINLAHRYYGPGDDNLNLLIAQNNLSKNEYITMKKGRKLIYYV